MNQPPRLLALCATTLVCASIVACGDYNQPDTGGAGTGGTTGGSGGTTGGTGGSVAGTGGSGGTGGVAGMATTGGTGGAVAGAGGAAGSGAGTAGTDAGTAGTAGSDAGAAGTAGGGSVPTCESAEPCGGDLVGTWTVDQCMPALSGEVDLESIGLPIVCTGAAITMGALQVSGTLTFNADGSYTDATTTMGQVVYEFPPECKELSGTTTDCPGIEGPLRSKGFTANTCVDNTETTGCTCTGTMEQTGGFAFVSFEYAESGTYETNGNELSMTSFGDDQEYTYCVSGNTLGVNLVSVSDTGTVSAPLTLTKM
jgi:hypothetical protein